MICQKDGELRYPMVHTHAKSWPANGPAMSCPSSSILVPANGRLKSLSPSSSLTFVLSLLDRAPDVNLFGK